MQANKKIIIEHATKKNWRSFKLPLAMRNLIGKGHFYANGTRSQTKTVEIEVGLFRFGTMYDDKSKSERKV